YADAVSRHGRFSAVGREDGVRTHADCGLPADALLAHPVSSASEGLHAASLADARRHPQGHAVHLGPVLQRAGDLGAGADCEIAEGEAAVRADLEALPP